MKNHITTFLFFTSLMLISVRAMSIGLLGIGEKGADLPEQNECKSNCGFEIGDMPEAEDFYNSSQGPFSVKYFIIDKSEVDGFKGGVVYYPENVEKKMALIGAVPGLAIKSVQDNKPFTLKLGNKRYLFGSAAQAQRLATYGFVTIGINTNNTLDIGFSRSKQIEKALAHVIELSKDSSHVLHGKIDSSRLGIIGHSNGGDAALNSASKNNISATVALAPSGIPLNKFHKIKVPSFISVCNIDPLTIFNLVPGWQYFLQIPRSTKKAYMRSLGSHVCNMNPLLKKNYRTVNFYSVAWMKRYLDKDYRYNKFLCGFDHGKNSAFSLLSYTEGNCK